MPTSIPYDSSLVLGNIVHPDALSNLEKISQAQGPIDAAEDTLNSYITMKRSLQMTIQELMNLNVDVSDVLTSINEVNTSISEAAKEYAKTRLAQEKIIQGLRATQRSIHHDIESPIDYNRTQIKRMPLSVDSLKMDVQYFSFDENKQQATNTIATIKDFISNSTSFLGEGYSAAASTAAASQVSHQVENHDVAGTLVISVGCTHKDAVLLAPFILDVDKGIRVWNSLYTDDSKKIKVNSVSNVAEIAAEEGTSKEDFLTILSGATYGSSFTGMVHVLRSESTESSQAMISLAANMQGQFEVGNWFSKEAGGFGVDSTFANDMKNLLSTQNVTSHVSLVTMGSIPSIKSNQVQIGVKTFADFDPAKMMTNLATLANATTSDQNSVAASSTAAQTGAQMLAIQGSTITNVLLGLDKIDDGQNKILDINSMMTAFEDYVDKAIAGQIGVPIEYYLKNITRAQLAEMWMAKYYPNKYLAISGDDSALLSNGGGSQSTSSASPTPAQAPLSNQ